MEKSNNSKDKDHFIHKHGYTFLFRNREIMESLIRDFVSKELYEELDFTDSRMVPEKHYITDSFAEFAEDMVYEVKLRGEQAFIYILTEFQSKNDHFMALRILHYMILFWLEYLKEYREKQKALNKSDGKRRPLEPKHLPKILPILLYNGSDEWKAPTNIKNLIEKHDFLDEFYPDFSYFSIIENRIPMETLKSIPSVVSFIFQLDTLVGEDLEETVKNLDTIEGSDDAIKTIAVWIKHLVFNERLDEKALVEITNIKNKKEAKSMFLENFEGLKQKWREDAIALGEARGEYKLMKSTHGFVIQNVPWEVITNATGVTEQEYKQWLKDNPQE